MYSYRYQFPALRPGLAQAPAAPVAPPAAPAAPAAPARRATNVGDILMLAGGGIAAGMGGYGLYKGLAMKKPAGKRRMTPLWLIGNGVVAALGITVLIQKVGRF